MIHIPVNSVTSAMGYLLLLAFSGDASKQVDEADGGLIGLIVFRLISGLEGRVMDLLH
jgi:hypothetical protein